MILGIIYNPNESTYTPPILPEMQDSSELFELFRTGIPTYLIEIAVSLLPIILFFLAAQFLVLRLSKRKLFQIGMGLVYTYIGLVLFLTGANVGFMPAGHYLGQQLASYKYSAVVIPVAMVMGYFIVRAEPAVYVLNRQVEEITDGAISAKAMGIGLSVGVSISLGLAMIRVLTGISILWFLIRRRRFRPHDRGVSAPPRTGRVHGRRRQYGHRCLRCRCHGRHDAAHHHSGHGPRGKAHAAP